MSSSCSIWKTNSFFMGETLAHGGCFDKTALRFRPSPGHRRDFARQFQTHVLPDDVAGHARPVPLDLRQTQIHVRAEEHRQFVHQEILRAVEHRVGQRSPAVEVVRADVHRDHAITLDVENRAQVALDLHGVDDPAILRGEAMDLVGAQPGIKWVLFEDSPSTSRGLLLAGSQGVEAFPKLFSGLEAVAHFRRRDGGFAPLNTVSMSTNRPASASAMPCLNSFGTQESSFSTTNLATFARSAGGSSLNSSMSCFALTAAKYRVGLWLARRQ